MDFQKQLEHNKTYSEAFWQQEMIDRPFVAVAANPRGAVNRITQKRMLEACMKEEYQDIVQDYLDYSGQIYYAGEALPKMTVDIGPDQYAAYLGGELKSHAYTGLTWTVPFVEDWEKFTAVIDKSENGYFQKHRRMIEYLAKAVKGKSLIEMIDLHGNMDALSAMRGPMELSMDFYDCPEEVLRAVQEVRGTYREIYDMIYKAGNMPETGTIAWYPMHCQGKGAIVQCDYSCMISPELGRKYVFPAIAEEAEYLDHCVYHLDGPGALGHLDTILSIEGIDTVQWYPGDGHEPSYRWMDVLKKIQAAGKSLWLIDWSPEAIKTYYKELEPNKVAFSLEAKSPDEAEELLEYLRKHT